MSILVLKFGGTSVADIARIQHVAERVKAEHNLGHKVLVVVSAMAGVTNKLVEYCAEVSKLNSPENLSEYDAAVSSGEVVTSALLALSLQTLGIKSRSFQAWQLPIRTNNAHAKALVENIETKLIYECFEKGIVPIVAGFQGLEFSGRITTLGRGGSDTTAAALAAALSAERCDIYTDVEGVFTTDPRMVSSAKKLDYITYEEMLEFASLGAKVLHHRAVQIAMRYSVPIRVLSTFKDGSGTIITAREKIMETAKITGVAYNHTIALIKIQGFQNYPKDFTPLYDFLVGNGTHIDSLMHYSEGTSVHSVVFTVPLSDVNKVERLKNESSLSSLYSDISINSNIVTISLIGMGVKSDPSIAYKMLSKVADLGLNVHLTFSSETKLSVVVDDKQPELIVRQLHEEFIG
ncbi:MAG: aspartate kinase [Rickettsiaceae bacterium]|jgi:aspartate kinase|nr:aspartate kinase [Rickettsiaceae bacterium]